MHRDTLAISVGLCSCNAAVRLCLSYCTEREIIVHLGKNRREQREHYLEKGEKSPCQRAGKENKKEQF